MDLPEFAISINQPWASLIVEGHKDIENRNWNTTFRGEVMIHAGLKVDKEAAEDLVAGLHPARGRPADIPHLKAMPTGGIIGIAEVTGVITEDSRLATSWWFVGRYGFLLANARPIDFIPCVGALGFFRPDFSLQYKPKPEPKSRTKPVVAPVCDPQARLFE